MKFNEPDYWFGNDVSGCLLSITLWEIGDVKLARRVRAFYNKHMWWLANIENNIARIITPRNPQFQQWLHGGIDANVATEILHWMWERAKVQIDELELARHCGEELEDEIKTWLGCIICAKYRDILKVIRERGFHYGRDMMMPQMPIRKSVL